MKLSLDWLSDFVNFTETDPERIGVILTEKAAEIDQIVKPESAYERVVSGKLLEAKKIAGSTKLHQAQFDLGSHGVQQIIFGDVFPLKIGEILPIALDGTELPSGTVIKATKIMGVPTAGMVCSDAELGFHFTTEGLLRFPSTTPLGMPIMEILKAALQHVVIGEILEIKKHSDADKLSVTEVRTRKNETRTIVCGGSNLKVGAKVPVALPGANLWGTIPIKKAPIRGVESNGMICSTEELRVGPSQNKEIYLLPKDAPVGKSFFEYVLGGDTVFVIENPALTNRPDLFSHVGFAREIVACELGQLKQRAAIKLPQVNKPLPIEIKVPQDPKICQRYMAVALSGVDGKRPSPEWMQRRLRSCGIRALSALVDITNYVMLEHGVPMHAFDLDRTGAKWNMRLAHTGEKMITLDGIERNLTDETIIFENEKNGIFDLCGIMGGLNSGIAETTHQVLLHSMSYDPVKIRRTALNVGPRTEAAGIFEKNVPVTSVEAALKRAVELILEIFPEAKIVSKIMDQQNTPIIDRKLKLDPETITRIAGIEIPKAEIERILQGLGFQLKKEKDSTFTVTVPGWRAKDIQISEDLSEEIVRIYGLNRIPETAPEITIASTAPSATRKLEQRIAQILTQNGCYEILTLAFLGPELLARCGFTKLEEYISLENPLSADLSVMRPSLSPRLLETAERNRRYRDHFRLFESGNVFRMENGEKIEEQRITVLLIGDDFLTAKGIAEEIMAVQGWKARLTPWENLPSFLHPGRNALFRLGKNGGIKIAELSPQITQEFGLPRETALLCMNLRPLAEISETAKRIAPLPKYQEIPFDFSVLCARKLPVADLIKDLTKLDSRIAAATIMETWEGKDIPEGQKSVTISCEFRAPDRTLTETERDELFQLIRDEMEQRGAKMRFAK